MFSANTAGTQPWAAYSFGQTDNTYSLGAAIDSSQNCYFGGLAFDSVREYAFVFKANTTGTVSWQRKLYDTSGGVLTAFYSVKVDASGNVYGAGASGDFGIVVKYNSSGTIQWQRKISNSASTSVIANDVAVDSSGNVYVAATAYSAEVGLLIKYNSSGVLQWQRQISTSNNAGLNSVVVDSSGNVYVAGYTQVTQYTAFIAKYNSSGTLQWQRYFAVSTTFTLFYSMGVDSSANVYGVGVGNSVPYIVKYNTSGAIQSQVRMSGSGSGGGGAFVDSSGNTYFVTRDTTPRSVVKFNSSNVLQWQRSFTFTSAVMLQATSVSGNTLTVAAYSGSGTPLVPYQAYGIVMPINGEAYGGVAYLTMGVSSFTTASGAGTDSAGSATDAAGSATDAAAGLTDAAGTLTINFRAAS